MEDQNDSQRDSKTVSVASDMESVTGSNYQFRVHDKRRHHGIVNNPYYLPADSKEVNRLDALQFSIRTAIGRNVLAPIGESATRILDAGTGSGKWAIEVAEEYPSTQVIGIDLSPIQPRSSIPANCEFVVGDVTQKFPYDNGSIDLVHSRLIHSGITRDQWPLYMNGIFRILKPGKGWVQCCEMLPWTLHNCEDSVFPKLHNYTERFHHSKNLFASETGEQLVPLMQNAGFVDIQVFTGSVDNGDWREEMPKDEARAAASRSFLVACGDVYPALVSNFKEYIPDEKEREAFAERAVSEFKGGVFHLTYNFQTVIGRRPPDASQQ